MSARVCGYASAPSKSDKLDAQVLAEFLASDEIPLAYRPCPRVREHRALVKNKLRHILSAYIADVPNLFTGLSLFLNQSDSPPGMIYSQ